MATPTPFDHILSIYGEYTSESRVLRSFTNLSNSVIQTALSGQSKFVFELLQNADDAYEEGQETIHLQFVVTEDLLIVHHNGKGFDYYDVERICDYASQVEEVKAHDLSKTGYKGLGFKSLFNLSDTIYICSNGYSFRFDKTIWPSPEERPWQIIPIWCAAYELPLHGNINYSLFPVNIILRLKDVNQIQQQLWELVNQPDLLLYLHRIDNLRIYLNGQYYYIHRLKEAWEDFSKVTFLINSIIVSTWLTKTYELPVPPETKKCIQGASRFIYPDKIKKAKNVNVTYALKCEDETLTGISLVKGLCYSTLPTQLYLSLPYHINSFFILNLDRTQLHENEWNEFLIEVLGKYQLCLLKDLATKDYLKNYVALLFCRHIDHPYRSFARAFLRGYQEANGKIPWLPSHGGSRLLRLGEAWSDDIEFFKQNFYKIRDHTIYPYLIDYRVLGRENLLKSEGETKHFNFDKLFEDFPEKYCPQLNQSSHIEFISYLYKKLKGNSRMKSKLRNFPFLITRHQTLTPPHNALIEESENPIPHFSMLNPIDNNYLPEENIKAIKEWLCDLGARRLSSPIQVIRNSILMWLDSGANVIEQMINKKNHIDIINYLSRNIAFFNGKEIEKLREKLIVLVENNYFKPVKQCYFPDAVSVKELADVVLSNDEKLSSVYEMTPPLRGFFIRVGANSKLSFLDVLNRSIFEWLENDKMKDMITESNYKPIIDYIASNHYTLERPLPRHKRELMKKFPVLTLDQTFHKAQFSYFDSALPDIKGFRHIIAKNRQVSSVNISKELKQFLIEIGVKTEVDPLQFVRESIIKWVNEGENLSKKITKHNHIEILKYIAQHLPTLQSGLQSHPKQRNALKNILILSQDNTFSPARECYWPVSKNNCVYSEEIPGIEHIISPKELVSTDYDLKSLKATLEYLGVRNIQFTDIYEKYSDHLNNENSIKWFFSHLLSYWKNNKTSKQQTSDQLLKRLQKKFKTSSCLLAKNKKVYSSVDLYSSKFVTMHFIDPNSVPILAYEKLPEDLEDWLGFKKELDLLCIIELFKALEKKPLIGDEETLSFYQTILEQLRSKSRDEVRNYDIKLLSKQNKLVLARNLYYFKEEEKKCKLEDCYLRRIIGMSHSETLELAEICGVNIVPFKEDFDPINETASDSLKTFYMARLPFIAVQESRELSENSSLVLKRLFEKLNALKFYNCQQIKLTYPFGNPIDTKFYFDDLTVYFVGNWKNFRRPILKHLKEKFCIKTDIDFICSMDMDVNPKESTQNWLNDQTREDVQKFNDVKAELQKLLFHIESKNNDKSCDYDNSSDGKNSLSENELSDFEDSVSLNSSEQSSDYEDPTSDETTSEKPSDVEESSQIRSLEDSNMKGISTNELNTVDKDAIKTQPISEKVEQEKDRVPLADQLRRRTSSVDSWENMLTDGNKNNVISVQVIKDGPSCEDDKRFKNDPLRRRVSTSVDQEENIFAYLNTNNLKSEQIAEQLKKNGSSGAEVKKISNFLTGIRNENNTLNAAIKEQENIILKKVRAPSINSTLDFSSLLPAQFDDIQKKAIKKQLKESGNNVTRGKLMNDSNPKRLRENFVFTHLQNHYKKKYPNAKCKLSFGNFTLRWQSLRIDIVWLNELEDIQHPYDIILKKDGKVKQLIEVNSVELMDNNLFMLSHLNIFKSIKKLPPKYEEKYCCCYVLGEGNPLLVADKKYNPVVIYKIVPVVVKDIK